MGDKTIDEPDFREIIAKLSEVLGVVQNVLASVSKNCFDGEGSFNQAGLIAVATTVLPSILKLRGDSADPASALAALLGEK